MAFQDHFSYYGPTRLIMGRGTIGNIPQILNEQQVKKAQIVTDRGLVQASVVARVTEILDKSHIAYSIYDGVEPNPPIRNVEDCAAQYQSENCDFLLAIGGGSSMDVAKTSGVLVNHGGKITDYFIGEKPVPGPIPFLLCVPTTYGTASEVTPFAVITDDNHFKGTVSGPYVIPDVGILDADMAVALPLPIAAATGMDALTHAIESYVSLMSNPISEGMALHAIRLISQNLRQAAYSDHNHEATQNMIIGSTMAGFAFSQTRLGNVHAMSHPVGGHYGVPHGIANSILLTRIMTYNRYACPEKFADIAAAMGEDVNGLGAVDASVLAVEAVQNLSDDVGIPATLGEAGAKAEGIHVMAEDAMKSGNIQVNPRKTTIKDVIALYEESM
ncbi:MAG: iron-containing alcohol dehydrogenase [Gemmatimonadetes bacterium]|nr:iron-containing alcohol dehydrogenase [Gemmatimonadota bacterium]MYB55355.1 iron-containing alcohol dehydrogenase [Gemmatimonadota bacterium]